MSGHDCHWQHLRDISDTVEVQVCTKCLTTRLVRQEDEP